MLSAIRFSSMYNTIRIDASHLLYCGGSAGRDIINSMMGYNNWGMMGGVGAFGTITWFVLFVDLVFLGVWLWKQISK